MKQILPLLLCVSANAQPVANPAMGGANFGFGGFCLGAILGGLIFYWGKSQGEHQRLRFGRHGLGHALTAGGALAGLALFYAIAFKL